MLQEQQAAAGVTQKQAAILLRDQTHKLVQSMISYLSNPNLLTTQIIDFPNIKGKIFAF